VGDIAWEMSRTPSKSRQAPTRRARPPRRTPKRGGSPNGSSGGGATPALKTWLIVGGGILGVLVLWQVLGAVLGTGDAPETRPPALVTTGATGALGSGDAAPAPAGTRTGVFPDQLDGSRLDMNVVALGTTPHDCTAQTIRTGGQTLAVYHHRCPEAGVDRYFFLVRMTNHAKGRVYVRLDGFTLEGSKGKPLEPFPTPPVGSPQTRFFEGSRSVAADQTVRGWVTFDGSGGFAPAALVYADGKELLRVRFQGDWS